MSIKVQISSLEHAGRLRRYVPELSRKPPKRRLYLADQAIREFDDRNSAVNMLVGRGFLAAALARWVSGDRIIGNKKRGLFLDRLTKPPPEIWELRVTEPIVQARIFSRFAEPDTLIVTKFHTRPMLGDKGSQAWNSAMQSCDACWCSLFPGVAPFSGGHIYDYVTENCDDFPLN